MFPGDFEPALDPGPDYNGFRARQFRHIQVGNPVRGGDNHFISRVEQGLHQVVDAVFCPAGNEDLLCFVRQAVFTPELVGDSLFEFGHAAGRGVFCPAVADGLVAASLICSGVSKSGLARAEGDDVAAGRLFNSAALAVTARVGEGLMLAAR